MILVIDNYDSFVYNLVHYVEDFGVRTEVVRNNALSVDEALRKKPRAIILSPGPCTPNEAGICLSSANAPEALPLFASASAIRLWGRRLADVGKRRSCTAR